MKHPEVPETPEKDHSLEAPSPAPTTNAAQRNFLKRIPLHGPQAWLWMTVLVLVFANVMFLFLSDTKSDPTDDVQQLEDEADQFERLSFWQQLWDKDQAVTPERVSVFDGLPIDPDSKERAVSVMIDNHSLARPGHEGLRAASIVHEALVEGGITRLMLVFPYQELDRVGPVRSARDYFVDYAEEYGGLYAHAGGSPQALDQLWKSDRVYSIEEDERVDGETYSIRDDQFDPPHNLFFDLFLTREFARDKGYTMQKTKKEWCFVNQKDQQSEDASSSSVPQFQPLQTDVSLVELNFSHDASSSYYVQFQYDAEDETYRRFYYAEGREPHIDQGDKLQVAPKNLIVQIAPSYLIEGDEKERLAMNHLGEGVGYYYAEGKRQAVTWKKETPGAATRFYDETGQELCVIPGQIWIATLDNESLILENGVSVSERE